MSAETLSALIPSHLSLREIFMTVCIVALYEHGKGVILVSDRMVTAHFPIGYEFEHQEDTKITSLDDNKTVYVMMAGDVLCGNEIVEVAKLQMVHNEREVSVQEAAEIIRLAYQKVRLTNIIHRELEPRGLDLSAYYARHQQLSPQIVQMVDQALCNFDLGVEMLVAAPNGDAHTIHTVVNPGVVRDNSPIGYSAIGSGAPHAIYSLIESSYNSATKRDEVVKLVKKAKERSEVAPGVGKETTVVNLPNTE